MSLAAAATQGLVFRALETIRGGELVLRFPGGRGRRFGDRRGPSVLVDVHRPEALWTKLARRTRVGMGESYVDGDWDADDLVALLELLVRNANAAAEKPLLRWLYKFQELRPHLHEPQTPDRARNNIYAHYDLGNDLFRLMLDPTMTYSCAYWERPELTLEEAQLAKYRRICEKLLLGPGDDLLEIGCGWGGFSIFAAREYGCRVTGLTISPSQAALAVERVREAGLERRIEIREQDYRLTQGRYSRIASIEMLEAIGHGEYERFFAACDRLLARDGIAVIQTIGMPDERFERHRRTPNWIQQYVFPGSLLPSLQSIANAVATTRLVIHGLEEVGIFYARTLREWRENFWASIDRVRELGYDGRFERVWTYYLAFCEAAFATRSLRDMQLVLTRAFNDALPGTPTTRVTF